MADDPSRVEAKLKLLGERVLAGVAQLHPPSAKTLAAVHEVVAEQWQREQEVKQTLSQGERPPAQQATEQQTQSTGQQSESEKAKAAEKTTAQNKSGSQSQSSSEGPGQSKDHGHSH